MSRPGDREQRIYKGIYEFRAVGECASGKSLGSNMTQVWLRVPVLTFTRKVWVNHSLL